MFRIFTFLILGFVCLSAGVVLLFKGEPKLNLDSEFIFEKSINIESKDSKVFIYQGFIWAYSKEGSLLKLDLNGQKKASYKIPYEKLSADFFVENSILYAISKPKKVFAYDLEKERILWDFDSQKKILAALSSVDNLLIFASYDSNIYALDKENGALSFKYTASDAINESVAIDESKIYFGDCSGFLTSFDMQTKQVISENISEHLPSLPIILGENIFVLDYQNTLFCLDKNSLEEIWQMQIEAKTLQKIEDKIYCLSPDLSLLDVENMRVEKLFSQEESIEFIAKLDEKTLALTSNYGTLYIYDTAQKKLKWQYKFGLELSDLKAYLDKIFIRDIKGSIYIIKRNIYIIKRNI